ncbi:nuclear GTPase SLIP-GC-like isoform X2 [Danio aesculapii]|uniref:nuclear GTPase SLIP-GC-like isoform X2 n=1 Tax=Danio aesculapii TaxID=1142201 RepID=UPI0024BFF2E3|nr:nuclear GTPase SLIP-GC-like isoform X2 [Danio aesculapii]
MDSYTINFITWNANGLKQNKYQKFQELQCADVVFLQETHIGAGDEHVIECLKDQWNVFYTKYTSSSRGTAILVRKSLDFKCLSVEKDNCGEYVLLKCELEGCLYTLVSVYNHQTDTKTLDYLSRYLQSMTSGLLVIGGDFNTFLNPFIDKKWNTGKMTKNRTHNKLLLCVENFMESLQLADVWRRKNPVKQDFTFYIRDRPVSRLDYFFIPDECMWRVGSCEIMNSRLGELKDHQPVSLEINCVSTVPLLIDQTQSLLKLFNCKKILLTDETGSSQSEESSPAVSEVDIVSAVQSLQVSDTVRPDDIPVSFYKDNIQDVIPYIKMLYGGIHRGEVNCSEMYFQDPQDDIPHFFNADYLIIATILARRLDDLLTPQSKGMIKDSATVMITPKTICTEAMLCCLKDEIEDSHSVLYQDFLLVEKILRDSKFKKCQGCPLKPVLTALKLKRYALKLCKNVENYAVHVFKTNVIICIPSEDLDEIHAMENDTNEEYIITLFRGQSIEGIESASEDYDGLMEDTEDNSQCEDSDNGSNEHEGKSKSIESDGRMTMYAVVTLKESEEVMVTASNWLSADKKQCYWPPYRSTEKFMEAVRKGLAPQTGEKSWEKLAVLFHGEYGTYEEAKKKLKEMNEQTEQAATAVNQVTGTCPQSPGPSQSGIIRGASGTKRKRDSMDLHMSAKSYSDEEILNMAKKIMIEVNVKLQSINSTDQTTNDLKNTILDGIAKMNEMDKDKRRKETIGVFGKTGEGKSSLLNAVLGLQGLLPSGSLGACTGVIIQVEANLEDSEYKAEIELISKEEWENEIASTDERTETDNERIIAVYGADADKKSLEELKNDAKYAEIDYFLSTKKKTISHTDLFDFRRDVKNLVQNSEDSPGGLYWPLMKSVTIKIPKRQDLLEHIVLFDIPGTGDCNKIRDDLWKSKVRECSSVWIVNGIIRAISSKEPWSIIEHCIQDLGPAGQCKNINFICTRTDDIDIKEYQASAQLSGDQFSPDKNLKTACIHHRNDRAKDSMKKKFETMKPKDRFIADVFTVSSRAYFDNDLHLDQNETEIPKLQDLLKNTNKIIKKELTREYVNQAKGVLFFIQSIKLDTNEEMAKIKAAVRKDYCESFEKALRELNCRFDSLHEIMEQCLSKGVEKSVEQCVSTTKPVIAYVKPSDKTLQALCRNKGYYWPKNKDAPVDLNKCLAKHIYDNIDEEFNLIFPVVSKNRTGRSVQEQIDKFSIIQNGTVYPPSSMLYHIQSFMKTEETKVKTFLKRDVVHKKKTIYTSIQTTIQDQMAAGYKKAAEKKGVGAMGRRENTIIETIESLKHNMFKDAKMEFLDKFKSVTRCICESLKLELSESVERSFSQSSKASLMDVSKYIETLEILSEYITEI